jgi:hypothetical protein
MSAGRWIVVGIAVVTVLYIGQAIAIAIDDLRWYRSTRKGKRR